MGSKERGVPKTLAALLIVFIVALFSTGDIMKIIPFFDPITSSTIFPYIHDAENLIALSLMLWAAYRYSTNIGLLALTVYIALHIPYVGSDITGKAEEVAMVVFTAIIGFAGIWTVSLRKRAEEDMAQSKLDLEVAQKLTKIGNWKWDIATGKITWSLGLCRINKWDPQKPPPPFVEMSPFYSPESWKRINEAVNKCFVNGEPYEIELDQIRTDGTTIKTETRGEADFDSKGKLINIHGTVQDITEIKSLQEQLIMQDRLVSIGQLVSGVAHEINNPLTSVIGFSELLLQRQLPDDIRADVLIVNEEAKRTSLIVRNLLTFARQQPQDKHPIRINEPIQSVLMLRNHEQNLNSIGVNTRFDPSLPLVMANGSQLQQVFFNLVTNAEFAMTEAHNKGTITITTEKAGGLVRVSIADDGPGITPENMKRLFSPFFTTKELGKGTGLGLSICQGIITEHGGKIWAESEPGSGVTFKVELPVWTTFKPENDIK